MLRDVFEARKKILKNLVENGNFSIPGICRIFEADETRIFAAAKEEGLDLSILPQKDLIDVDAFIQARNKKLEALIKKEGEEKALETFGLWKMPTTDQNYEKLLASYEPETEGLTERQKETYMEVFDAIGISRARYKGGTKHFPKSKDWQEVFARGQRWHYLSDVPLAIKALLNGEKYVAVERILNDCYGKRLSGKKEKLFTEFEKIIDMSYSPKLSKEQVFELLQAGNTGVDIRNVTFVTQHEMIERMGQFKKEFGNESHPLWHRKQNQAEIWFDEYVKNGLTQQEIADKYGVSRRNVMLTLNEMRAERADEEKEILMNFWRQRNVAQKSRDVRKTREENVLLAYDYDSTYAEIGRQAGVSASKVKEILEAKGLGIATMEMREQLKAEISKEWRAGRSIEEMARIFERKESTISNFIQVIQDEEVRSYEQEEFMKKSYKDGMSTTEIMAEYGFDKKDMIGRQYVLNRQRKSSRYILGHPELKPPVIENKGDVPGIFTDKTKRLSALIDAKERQEMERE